MHYHYRSTNPHLEFMARAKWNLQKMFTPPKSKSPWEAMTTGSTGGWAAGLKDWGAPAIVGGSALLAPFTGGTSLAWIPPALGALGGAAGMMGGGTGFQGTDKGWNNLLPTIAGAAGGYGAGLLGAGIGSATQAALSPTRTIGMVGGKALPGAQSFINPATGQPANLWQSIVGGMGAGMSSFNQPLTNAASGLVSGIFGKGTSSNPLLGGVLDQLGTATGNVFMPRESKYPGDVSTNPLDFSLANVAKYVLGGTGALMGMGGGYVRPELKGNKEEALSQVYAPNLVEARGLIRDLALAKPEELISPAGDAFVNASLRQSRLANERAREQAINTYSARGQVPGKSGAVDKALRQMTQEQVQRESDYIATINESRKMAATKLKVDAVSQYYNVSADEAAQVLAANGYINPIDYTNYMAALGEYQSAMQLQGAMQVAPLLGR